MYRLVNIKGQNPPCNHTFNFTNLSEIKKNVDFCSVFIYVSWDFVFQGYFKVLEFFIIISDISIRTVQLEG